MIKKGLLAASWFLLTLALVVLNISLLLSISPTRSPSTFYEGALHPVRISAPSQGAQMLGASILAADARALLLQLFLAKHSSPMAQWASHIVSEADRYGLDYRLVVAIAMCESNLGKRMPKKDEFNAWGIAVYSGENKGKAFSDWPSAISWVSGYVKTRYLDRGITDLKDIGAIWAPPSVENDYSWTSCVENFQQNIL